MEVNSRNYDRIAALVKRAEKLKVREFRAALERLVGDGAEEEEYALVQHLNETDLPPEIRLEIIRVAGNTRRSAFLVPLKKIIDHQQHSRLQQEAILAVARYDDRRALNILNHALNNIKNPLLQRTIHAEIRRIKENNPILGLLPRFQEGEKNAKTFKVTLEMLKRILTPKDATIFTKFLGSPDPLIQNGAFEILCITGDIFHDSDILDFYQDRFGKIPCIAEVECEALYLLTYHIKQYLSRYQFLIEEQVPTLKQQFRQVGDIRVKQLLLSLMCRSKNTATIGDIETIYREGQDLRETIVQELAGNDAAADFLFDRYKQDESLKETIIKSLLTIKKGLDFFLETFFSLAFEEQEMIVQNLPYAGRHDLVEFIKRVFQGDIYRLKEILLSKVRETHEFSVKTLLFAPESEREFYFMGDQYLDTIIDLFPVTAVNELLEKIAYRDISVNRVKKYLGRIADLMPLEMVFNFESKDFLQQLFTRIIKANNRELSLQFFGILKGIRTFDINTYNHLREAMNLFLMRRETAVTPQEKGELERVKRNLKDIQYEVAQIQKSSVIMKRILKGSNVNFQLLREALRSHHMAVVMQLDELIDYLSARFEKSTLMNIDDWLTFFKEYPRVAQLLKSWIHRKVERGGDRAHSGLVDLDDSLGEHPLRAVIRFQNRGLTAIFREQFSQTVPSLRVVIDQTALSSTDILLCDTDSFKDIILQTRILPNRIYLFLEGSTTVSEFKLYNPRPFVRPFVFHRIMKEILQQLCL